MAKSAIPVIDGATSQWIAMTTTLLKIIKGTHVRNGMTGLPYSLHFMHDVWLIDYCLSYI